MEQPGHNVNAGSTVAGERLRSFIERVERLEETIAELNGDKKEVYAEARGEGYDVATVKKIVRRRATDRSKLEEAEALLELYESALNGG